MKSKLKIINITKLCILGVLTLCTLFLPFHPVFAEDGKYGLGMSPLNQKIILNAGENYTGSFNITNPDSNAFDFKYKVYVQPFYVDENYNIKYEENAGYNQIVDWITLDTTEGILKPNTSKEIFFTVNVPNNAPNGGQYAAITVQSKEIDSSGKAEEMGVQFNQNMAMAQIIYAEIAGTTVRQGEVQSVDVPSFLLSGNITASSTIKNTGNTHGTATYKLQVFPLFSNEEVFTNEENPDEKTILPERSLYNETIWDKTPDVGIFNIKYTVDFEGVTTEVSKMVIKCPVWLLLIIFFVIFLIIFWIVMRVRKHSKSTKRSNTKVSE